MSAGAWFLLFTLVSWGSIALALAAVYYLAASFGRPEPSRSELRRAFIRSLFGAAILGIAGCVAPHRASGIALPVIWPILPFSAWASITCLIASVVSAISAALANTKLRFRGVAPAVWLVVSLAFYILFRHSGEKASLAKGWIALSPVAGTALAVLAILACLAMAGSERAVRTRGYARVLATHTALLAGCLIFGLPFFWLLLTSFKEDRDMASPTGLVWIPKVQDMVSTFDAQPPLYQTDLDGSSVQVNILSKNADGTDRVEVIHPEGIQGRTIDYPPSALKRIPSQAPVVTGPFHGQTVSGYVIQDFDDGRQRVRITKPAQLAGQVFIGLPKDLQPVRHVGLRWQNYSEALEFLPTEANMGLTYLQNTLIVTILSVIGTVLSSSIVAYGFSRLRFPGRDILFGVMLTTMMLPAAVTLLPRFIIFRDLGWIDTLYPLWTPAFFASAFNVFLLRQFFKNLPLELEDAAKIDGCSYLRSYWSVMLPQIKPALAVIAIWTFMGAWNDFMGPLIYISSPEKMTISYAVQMFATDRTNQPGLMMAFATMSIIPVVLLFFFAQRYFIEGVTLTGFGGK